MVLTAYSGLSSVTGLYCHRRPCNAARIITSLMPASGHRDHTASPSASARFVLARRSVHRIPHPTSVTTRTPLRRVQDNGGHKGDFSCKESEEFFERRMDRQSTRQLVGQISSIRQSETRCGQRQLFAQSAKSQRCPSAMLWSDGERHRPPRSERIRVHNVRHPHRPTQMPHYRPPDHVA